MMSESRVELHSQVKDVISKLSELSDQIDITDLGELAKIHEVAQELERIVKTVPDQRSDILCQFAKTAAETAEGIILESCPNPGQALETLCKVIQSLDEIDSRATRDVGAIA